MVAAVAIAFIAATAAASNTLLMVVADDAADSVTGVHHSIGNGWSDSARASFTF